MREDSNIDPKILAALDEEQEFMASHGRAKTDRVKIPKGSAWLLRFIPTPMGPNGKFWARIAFHWINKRPYLCVRNTGRDFGGDPEGTCPLCEVSDELNASPKKKIANAGYQARAVPQYLAYCLVFKRDDEPSQGEERWKPFEFWMHQSVFQEFLSFYKKGLVRSEKSIYDFKVGCDIWANNTNRGVRLDREDPSPICKPREDDPDRLKRISKKVLAAVKFREPQVPDEETMLELAEKIKENAIRAARSGDDDRGGRGRFDEDDERPRNRQRGDEEDERPRRGGDDEEDERPARRPARDEEDELPRRRPARDEEDEPAPRRSSARDEDEEPPRRRSSEDEDDAPAPKRQVRDDDEGDLPPQRRRADDDNDEEPEEAEDTNDEGEQDEDPAPRRSSTPPPSRAQEAPARHGTAQSTVDEEEDNAPEEDRDPAPPVNKGLDESEDEAPPKVESPKTAAKSSNLSKRIQDGIKGAQNRP